MRDTGFICSATGDSYSPWRTTKISTQLCSSSQHTTPCCRRFVTRREGPPLMANMTWSRTHDRSPSASSPWSVSISSTSMHRPIRLRNIYNHTFIQSQNVSGRLVALRKRYIGATRKNPRYLITCNNFNMPSSEPSEPGQPSKEPQPPMPYEESPIVSLVPVPPVVSSMPLFEDVLIEALTMPAVSVPEPSTLSTSNGRPTPDQRLILGVGSVPVGARWKSQLSARKEALSVPSDFTVDDCIAFLRTMRDASRADNPTPISASDDQTQPPTSAALKMPTPSSSDNAPGNGISMHTAEALQGLLPSPTASTNASEERISPVVVDNAPRSRLYILDSLTGKLVGCVYIEDLLLCEDRTKLVESIRRECEVVILDTEPLNNAAHIMRDRSLYNAAVVNSDYMLVGVLSAGDIIQEMEIEASEEIYRFGGLGSTMDSQDQFSESYFSVPSRRFITSRSSWLVTLLLLQSVSSLVLHHFQPLIEKNVILALFLTMLTGSAGNAGSQSSAIVIRGLATREINKDNAFELISRELLIGLCIAVILGGVAFVRVFITSGMSTAAVTAALTVGIALMLTVIFGILFGTIAPLVFHRLGIDPANASPALSTITDISGVLILCIVATLLLR